MGHGCAYPAPGGTSRDVSWVGGAAAGGETLPNPFAAPRGEQVGLRWHNIGRPDSIRVSVFISVGSSEIYGWLAQSAHYKRVQHSESVFGTWTPVISTLSYF
jgi:hypothetical protein